MLNDIHLFMKTTKREYKPIEPTSCLEDTLFMPIDLMPGIGYLTNISRIFNYNERTKEIRKDLREKQIYPAANIEHPDTRDLKRTIVAGFISIYHITSLTAIGKHYQVAEKLYGLIDKLF